MNASACQGTVHHGQGNEMIVDTLRCLKNSDVWKTIVLQIKKQTWKCPHDLFWRIKIEIILQVNRIQLCIRSIFAYCAGCGQEDDMLQEENVEHATSFLLHCSKNLTKPQLDMWILKQLTWNTSECIMHCVKYFVSQKLIYEKLCSWLKSNLFSKVWFLIFQLAWANEEKNIAK